MTPQLLTDLLHSPWAERVVVTLVHFLWQGSVVAFAVLLAALWWGKDVRRRYTISVCGLAALATFPFVTFAFVSGGRLWDEGSERIAELENATFQPSYVGVGTPSNGWNAALAEEAMGTSSEQGDFLSAAVPWVMSAWLAGVAVLSTRLLLGIVSLAWLKRTGELAGDMLREQACRLSRRLAIRTPVVRVSRRISQAVAVGFFRPIIIVPTAWLIELPPECLEAVLAHELAHIRRRDLWINLLQRVVETLLFFHPAVWWLSQRLRREREMCCDELAVSLTGRRVEYARTLELVARRRRALVAPVLAAGIGGEKMALLNRVRNVLGLAPSATGGIGPLTLGGAAIVAAGAVWWLATGGSPLAAFAADDESELVAFADEDEEGERERDRDQEGERDREGDRENRERDGDEREEGERRYRDRERDEDEREFRRDRDRDERDREYGDRDRPRDREEDEREHPERGDREGERRDRPHAEDFRRHIERMKRQVHALAEQGRHEEAERLEREIHRAVERFKRGHRDGDRPDLHPEIRAHLEKLHRRMHEAAEAGREEEAHELEREIHHIHQRLRAQRDGRGDRPRFERERPRPDIGPRDRELVEAIRALREEVIRLRYEVNELKGDRPRFEAHPPIDRDRPRFDRDRPRFRPDADREGEGRGRQRFRPDFERGERERGNVEREGDDRGERDRPRDDEEDREREGGED